MSFLCSVGRCVGIALVVQCARNCGLCTMGFAGGSKGGAKGKGKGQGIAWESPDEKTARLEREPQYLERVYKGHVAGGE